MNDFILHSLTSVLQSINHRGTTIYKNFSFNKPIGGVTEISFLLDSRVPLIDNITYTPLALHSAMLLNNVSILKV